MAHNLKFLSRTLLTKNNDVEITMRVLNKTLNKEKVLENYRRWQYYEKPCRRRIRLNFEKCKKIYDSDMQKKIKFVMKKHRPSPWPWNEF